MTEEQWAAVETIEGWLTRAEAELLYSLAETPWCEIGAWRGRSTRALAMNGSHGYTVDHWNGSPGASLEGDPAGVFEEWCRNTPQTVLMLEGDYADMAEHVPSGLSLLFNDHDHAYAPTRGAWDLYSPKVGPHGYVVFHDAVCGPGNPWPNVGRVCDEIAGESAWNRLADVERCAVFRRV